MQSVSPRKARKIWPEYSEEKRIKAANAYTYMKIERGSPDKGPKTGNLQITAIEQRWKKPGFENTIYNPGLRIAGKEEDIRAFITQANIPVTDATTGEARIITADEVVNGSFNRINYQIPENRALIKREQDLYKQYNDRTKKVDKYPNLEEQSELLRLSGGMRGILKTAITGKSKSKSKASGPGRTPGKKLAQKVRELLGTNKTAAADRQQVVDVTYMTDTQAKAPIKTVYTKDHPDAKLQKKMVPQNRIVVRGLPLASKRDQAGSDQYLKALNILVADGVIDTLTRDKFMNAFREKLSAVQVARPQATMTTVNAPQPFISNVVPVQAAGVMPVQVPGVVPVRSRSPSPVRVLSQPGSPITTKFSV